MKKDLRNTFKDKPIAELHKAFKESRERLRTLQFDLAAGKVKNVSERRTVRKDIARILTALREKQS